MENETIRTITVGALLLAIIMFGPIFLRGPIKKILGYKELGENEKQGSIDRGVRDD